MQGRACHAGNTENAKDMRVQRRVSLSRGAQESHVFTVILTHRFHPKSLFFRLVSAFYVSFLF